MSILDKAGLLLLVILISFAFGRYSANSIETKSSETIANEQKTTDTHIQTVTTTTQNPNGSVTVVQTKDSISETKLQEDIKQTSQETKVSADKKLTVEALAALDSNRVLSYGLHISKEVLGPINVGVFGLNNGTIGLSAGISF